MTDTVKQHSVEHYSPEAVANTFLELAKSEGDALSPMKLLKLVYYAHGWHLALEGEALLDEQIEAWDYGPVVPSLWGKLKQYEGDPVTEEITGDDGITPKIEDPFVRSLINQVWKTYGDKRAVKLSQLTHMPGTPWHEVKEECGGQLPRRKDIPNDLIRDYFEELL
jgi:uncharacterized phage-associated protein